MRGQQRLERPVVVEAFEANAAERGLVRVHIDDLYALGPVGAFASILVLERYLHDVLPGRSRNALREHERRHLLGRVVGSDFEHVLPDFLGQHGVAFFV